MKKLLFFLAAGVCFLCTDIKAQLTTEIIQPEPQTGQYNYFGVRLHLEQALDRDLIVSGSIYDDGSPSNSVPFTLTIFSGTQTAETANNILQACPACGAGVTLGTLTATYANVSVVFDVQANMLKFGSAADFNAVVDQLESDYEMYNTNYENQYPGLSADQLDDMDVQNNFDQFKPFKDFESLFPGFFSKRAEVENIENAWLSNNFTGADPDDTDLTFDDALNTIFNGNYSFKIVNSVYQLTSTGVYVNGVFDEDIGNVAIINNFNNIDNFNTLNSFMPPNIKAGPFYEMVSYGFAPSNCKSNKKDKIFQSFDNDTKRVKQKVSITSIAIRSSAGSKIVYYKRKNNGGWKNARVDMAVTAGGTVYNKVCAFSLQFSLRNPVSDYKKRNRIQVRAKSNFNDYPTNTIWRTYTNQIGMTFDVKNLATGSLALTF
ncbi:MAG: hypothetical protein HEQ40_10890 [Lacibacter sp.]|jgi:hypothetical protein